MVGYIGHNHVQATFCAWAYK